MKHLILGLIAFLFTTALCAQIPSYVPTEGLAAWWPFSGGADDVSGNGNNGVVQGAVLTEDRNGQPNGAYLFDGINDYIEVPNSPTLNMSSLTVAGWINCNNAPAEGAEGMMAIVSKWYNLLDCGEFSDTYITVLSNYNFSIRLESASSVYPGSTIISGSSVDLNEWVFFTYVHDELTGGAVYINGELAGTTSIAGEICTSTNSVLIGADNDGGDLWRQFSGAIDDVGIWSRALSEDEITGLLIGCSALPVFEITGDISPVAFNNSTYSYPNNSGSTYDWSVTNGVIVSGQGTNQIEVLWASEGIGSVSVVESDVNGCSGEQITLDVVIIPTSVEEHFNIEVEVYPNPCREYFQIHTRSIDSNTTFRIVDAQGRCVMQGSVHSSTTNIPTATLESGLYYFTLHANSQSITKVITVVE
jgi:hypothetical protein